jgi:hypothetical protein
VKKTVYHGRYGRRTTTYRWTDRRGTRHVARGNETVELIKIILQALLVALGLAVILSAAAVFVVILVLTLLCATVAAGIDGLTYLLSFGTRRPGGRRRALRLARAWLAIWAAPWKKNQKPQLNPTPSPLRLPKTGVSKSRFVDDIHRARREGRLPFRFSPDDVRRACPGWANNTYGVFLPKHRRGNPGGYTAYFERHAYGTYSLLNDPGSRRDVPTGTLLVPESLGPTIPDLVAARWVGAADVPGAFGWRMNSNRALAVLELTGSLLTLRIRPQFLARLFGMGTLQVEPLALDAIFPAKGRLRPAICVRPHGKPPYYFLIKDPQPILASLAAAGFPVQWEERIYSKS